MNAIYQIGKGAPFRQLRPQVTLKKNRHPVTCLSVGKNAAQCSMGSCLLKCSTVEVWVSCYVNWMHLNIKPFSGLPRLVLVLLFFNPSYPDLGDMHHHLWHERLGNTALVYVLGSECGHTLTPISGAPPFPSQVTTDSHFFPLFLNHICLRTRLSRPHST